MREVKNMLPQVATALLLACLILTVQSSDGQEQEDEQESEEIIERDRMLLGEWEKMSTSVYAKEGEAKEPGETLHLLRSMLDVEGQFSPKTMAMRHHIRAETESLVGESYASNLKCTSLFYHISLNHLIRKNLDNSLNVLPYLNHCKFEQFITCKDIWSSKLHSIVERMEERDRVVVRELVRAIKSARDSGESELQIPQATIKRGLSVYKSQLQTSDGLSLEEVRRAIGHATNEAKIRLDELTDILNQFLCDHRFASHMDQATLDWWIAGNVCRRISRINLDEETSQPMRNEGPPQQCWWLAA